MNHKGIPSFVFSDYNPEVMPTSYNEPKSG